MVVEIKSPNPDEIWERWKQKMAQKDMKSLKKAYDVRGAKFSLENITAAEYVKDVEKEAAVFIETILRIKRKKADAKKFQVDWKKLEKERFFVFKDEVDKTAWKYDDMTATFNSITPVECPSCGGHGYGSSEKKCRNCGGDGKYELRLDVYNEKGDKVKTDFSVPCPRCYGQGKTFDTSECGNCKGTGVVYKYSVISTPFKSVSDNNIIFVPSTDVSGFSQEMGDEILKAVQNVGGIALKKPGKYLKQKYIEPQLGYYSKNIKKMLKNASKDLKKAEKDDNISIQRPGYVFPLIKLYCETKKGKKFNIYSIGSSEKFIVFSDL